MTSAERETWASPIAIDRAPPSPARQTDRATEALWALSVLAVDDDDADVSLIATALRQNKRVRSVTAALEPIHALDRLAQGELRPDLILLDIQMPRVDGFTFLRAVREVPWMSQTPVIFLTTSGYERDVRRANGTDASGYIVKPDTFKELRARIDATIERFVLDS